MIKKNGKKSEKTDEIQWVRNVDKRIDFIKKFGEKRFLEVCKMDPNMERLKEIPCPPRYSWIFRHFMQIWENSEKDMMGNIVFTYRTINEYVQCFEVPLTVSDKKMLFKMKDWALKAISELKED